MFVLEINKNQVRVADKEPMTSGSQNVYVVEFKLSSEWDYLEKVAVFATDVGPDGPIEKTVYRQLLDENNRCVIPWEVNANHDKTVFIGLLGMANGNIILPTVWANVGSVLLGVTDGVTSPEPPTPDVYQQILMKLDQIQGISTLDVFTDKVVTNIHDFDESTIPGTIVMINSSINAQNMNLAFAKDVVYVEFVTNQNGSSLRIVSISNNGYDFNYNENGDFISMTPIPLSAGEKGDPGVTFTPSLSESGVLSWTNNGELPNPEPVSIKGPKGNDGIDGDDGASAYQVAINNGFVGTESEWLASLKGDKGEQGTPGQTGPDGKNATINGQSTLEIVAGENVTITQEDGVMTIGAVESKPILQSLKITIPSNKTSYTVGDTFDPTGMVVVATYDWGFFKTVTDYTFSPDGPLEIDTKSVVISYTENGVTVNAEQSISVTNKIYGVTWDGTSTTKWTRTDNAALFTDPIPYVAGASNYGSPFDNIMPWSGMIKEERVGGTMVAIPKFWYKLEQNTPGTPSSGISIKITDSPVEGFSVSPAHMDRGDGHGERDVVYIGRYHCGADYKSKTGVSALMNLSLGTAREGAHKLGETIWQLDFAMLFTIWLLYLVEFADWNSQACIGYDCGSDTPGYTDSMPYCTGTTLASRTTYGSGAQYRNIESLWGTAFDFCDGCYMDANGFNIILNPSLYSLSGGKIAGMPGSGFPTEFTVSKSAWFDLFYSSKAGGSDGTYSCDYWWYDKNNPVIYVGGYNGYDKNGDGLFHINRTGNGSFHAIGARIQELPN